MKKIQFRNVSACIILFLFGILIFGCARIEETTKGIIGISTRQVEEARKDALTKTFSCNYQTCYSTVSDTLKHISAYIYAKDAKKKMLAIYVSESDTTPVGIFFKEIDSAHTQVEVSSPSSYAKELIAKSIYSGLQKQGQSDEKK